MKKILVLSSLLSMTNLIAQKKQTIDVQYLPITDTIIYNALDSFIKKADKHDVFFAKKSGYVSLRGATYPNYLYSDTTFKFSISISDIGFNKYSDDGRYPPYYTIINSRVVVIYLSDIYRLTPFKYSEKSKNEFREVITPFLGVPKKHIEKDVTGKILWIDENYHDEETILATKHNLKMTIYVRDKKKYSIVWK